MRTLAIDIDLGRITMVDSVAGVLCHGVDPFDDDAPIKRTVAAPRLVLIEVAGPVMHHEESHSWRRWCIYNAIVAAQMVDTFARDDIKCLVSTSTAWTKGYGEKERHAIAGMLPLKHKTGKGKKVPIYAEAHDIRECRAMLYFYQRDPTPWKPLDQYLKELVG